MCILFLPLPLVQIWRNMTNNLKEWRKKYRELGIPTFPIKGKKPLVSWREYQNRLPTDEEIEDENSYNATGIAGTTGEFSGIIVIDCDIKNKDKKCDPEIIKRLREEGHPEIKTGSGGSHFIVKFDALLGITTKDGVLTGLDIKSNGGCFTLPPSIALYDQDQLEYSHYNGNEYKWVKEFKREESKPFPVWLLDMIKENGKYQKNIINNWDDVLRGVSEGVRNQTATSVIGKLLKELRTEDWQSFAWQLVCAWNERNTPPLLLKELEQTFKSIGEAELNSRNNGCVNKGILKPLLLSELMAKEFKNIGWIVDKLIPANGIIAISGAPASFKTWLMLILAINTAKGEALFNKFTTSKAGILLIDEENGERLLQDRFRKLQKNFDLPIYTISFGGFKLLDNEINNIISFCKEKNIGVVIFDSLIRIHNREENDAGEMAEVFSSLKNFNKNGITVIFTHHNRKQMAGHYNPSQDMRGSSDILASVDCHLAVNRKSKEDQIIVTQTKLRQGEEIKPFKLNIISDDDELRLEFAGEVDEVQNKKENIKEAIKDILDKEDKPIYKKELHELLNKAGIGGGYSTFKTAIKEMVTEKEVFEKKGEKNKVFCFTKPFEDFEDDDGSVKIPLSI